MTKHLKLVHREVYPWLDLDRGTDHQLHLMHLPYLWGTPSDITQESTPSVQLPFIGKPKIDQGGYIAKRQHDICRFNVVMRDTPFVEVSDSRAELSEVCDSPFW